MRSVKYSKCQIQVEQWDKLNLSMSIYPSQAGFLGGVMGLGDGVLHPSPTKDACPGYMIYPQSLHDLSQFDVDTITWSCKPLIMTFYRL